MATIVVNYPVGVLSYSTKILIIFIVPIKLYIYPGFNETKIIIYLLHILGCVQGSIRKLRTNCNSSCSPGFLLCLFSKVETFGLILSTDTVICIRYQQQMKKQRRNIIITTDRNISLFIRRFCASLPYRISMVTHCDLDQIQDYFISTRSMLTMRSTLLHSSDNFRFLFGLHIQIFFSHNRSKFR